jgi:ketosteroid isomerase-like protein
MSQENVELAYRSLDAFNRRDADAWAALLSPEVESESLKMSLGSERCTAGGRRRERGRRRSSKPWRAASTSSSMRSGTWVMTGASPEIVTTGRGRGSGVPFEFHTWQLVSFAEGLITRRQVFRNRDEALEAAGLEE